MKKVKLSDRIKNAIDIRCLEWKARFLHSFSFSKGIKKNEPQPLIISLTSFPARLKTCFLSIETLLNQSHKPSRVILWLSSAQINEKDLPKSLLSQQRRGLDIRFVEEDFRSYKKLHYALQEFSDALIITADDDLLYPKDWVKSLYDAYKQTPDCVVCHRAYNMELENATKVLNYRDW